VKSPGCGTLTIYGFYADTCVNAGFTTVNVLPNQFLIESSQDQWTFYTGQSINLTWTWPSTLFDNTERVTFSVYTPILRSILGSSGGGGGGGSTAVYENVTLGARTGTITTSTTSTVIPVTLGGPSPVQFSTVASTSVNAQSEVRVKNTTQEIIVLQSRITSVEARWNNSFVNATTNVPFNDHTFNVRWTAVGMARFGTATVSIQRCGGGGGGSSVCSQTAPTTGSSFGNAVQISLDSSSTTYEANITMSRLTTNNLQINSNYQFLVSIPPASGFGTFTYGSIGFVLGPAPPSASPSPTPSRTPTPSPSNTQTPSPTATPTGTPTATGTPSPTKSPVDVLTILLKEQAEKLKQQEEKQKAEAEAAKAATTGVVGGIIGGVIVIGCLGFVVVKVIQRRQSAERRQRKLAAARRNINDERESIYGVTIATVDRPSDKDIVNLAAYKASAKAQSNPMTRAGSLTAPSSKTVGRGSGRNVNRV
jgi:hypothetical protein